MWSSNALEFQISTLPKIRGSVRMDLRFAPLSIPLERRMQTFAVFFYMSMFLFLPMMTMTVSYVLLFHTANFRS